MKFHDYAFREYCSIDSISSLLISTGLANSAYDLVVINCHLFQLIRRTVKP
jgi:hypothetical protein